MGFERRFRTDEVDRPAFNAEAALARVDGNRELLRPMVGLFARQWSALLDAIARAGRQRDGAALELAAHRLKDSVASFGADQTRRVAEGLEARGRDGDFHDVERTCHDLKTELDRLVHALVDFAKSAGS
jgi:HPt (histidine-containing phosphotransfer) domain-containing protein